MAILANEAGMSSEGESQKQDSNHEFNVYIDRQVQNKLIQAAEDVYYQEDYESKLLKPTNNLKKNGKIDPRVEDITGWFPDAKFIARRNNDGVKNESNSKDKFIHPWRDYRARKEESFIFKHYTDIKKYMEQYRNEHGCHSVRYSSGGQIGELRRQAFQNSPAPPQQSVQVTVQQVQQGNSNVNNSSGLSYTNRKEQFGNQIVTNQTCSCSRASHNHADSANLSHRYKFAPGHMSRTNTDIRSQYGESDNSSDSDFGTRTPSRRISSATSVRSKQTSSKSPTKISVPANPNTRPYPMQALTIQQQQQQQQLNGRPEAPSSAKPLDNLNCVAPEKQMMYVGRKEVEPIGFSLHVHNIHNLLTANEAPLRGYALPKSSPPTPKTNDVGSAASDTDSIIDDNADCISLDQLSTCPLGADVHIRNRQVDRHTSDMLQVFFNDPVLSQLNQRPPIKSEMLNSAQSFYQPSYFGSDHIFIPQNNSDGMSRVNMWNPIVSTTPVANLDQSSNPAYRNMMAQVPFRKVVSDTRLPKTAQVDFQQERTYSGSRRDYFNPTNNVKLSITKLDNAVSFCRTSIETRLGHDSGKSRTDKNQSKAFKPKPGILYSKDTDSVETRETSASSRPRVQFYDTYAESKNKINLPLPKVKIFESIPVQFTRKSSADKASFPKVETKVFVDIERVDTASLDKDIEIENQFNTIIDQENKKKEADVQPLDKNKVSAHTLEKPKVEIVSPRTRALKEDDTTKGNELSTNVVKGTKISVEKRQAHIGRDGREVHRKACDLTVVRKARFAKKPSVTSGVLLSSRPEFEGLTWSEKLEVLRSVNKPPEKPKPKKPKLKFVKDEPEGVWTSEQEQLYEQRRIKHLVEQARIKGGKQFDWVYEAQSKVRGVDWETGKLKVETSTSSSETSGSEEDGLGQNHNRLGKYGIFVPPKNSKHKLFSSQPMGRSNTFVSQ